jgi:hypothetical protein
MLDGLGNRRRIGDWSGRKSAYSTKVVSTDRPNLVGYWPQWEVKGSVSYDYSGNNFNGAYTGVTQDVHSGDLENALQSITFDGSTSRNNVYSAALAAFFSGAAGTLSAWIKVSAAGVWSDGTERRVATFYVDANNLITIKKDTSNLVQCFYVAGGTSKTQNLSIGSPTSWQNVALTYDKPADAFKAYLNGTQVGSTGTGLGTWAGSLASTACLIGAATTTPTLCWSGTLAHVALWKSALNTTQIADLAKV